MASSARTSQRRARAGASPQAAAGGGRRANGGGGAQFGLEPRQVRAEGGFAQDQRWAGWLGGRVRGGKQRWGARSRTGRQTVRAFWPIDAFQCPPIWLHRIGASGGARAGGAARGQSDRRQSPRGKSCHQLAHHRDRKSTRLNSSHANISYVVLCLAKTTRVDCYSR